MENEGVVIEEVSIPDHTDAPVAEPKMLSQEQVNNIVKQVKRDTAEKARREYESKLQAMQSSSAQPASEAQQSPVNHDDLGRLVEERLAKIAQEYQEKARQQEYEAELQRIANTYADKMAVGKDLFPDFEEAMSDIDPADFYDVMGLASELDNTPEVMYELAKNLSKLEYIDRLAKRPSNGRKLAMKELERLSKSIAANQEAKEEHVMTNPPLSKPKPSQVGTEKPMTSVRDFKSASWLRG
jgi:hypothetical protein